MTWISNVEEGKRIEEAFYRGFFRIKSYWIIVLQASYWIIAYEKEEAGGFLICSATAHEANHCHQLEWEKYNSDKDLANVRNDAHQVPIYRPAIER